ncbi:hypothetical protein ACFWHS_02920 [Glutamicibacter sp. NPDC058337]|uniref:hypothetical protein n=1 Tax=Glutamicibacter sp. NPDC058337 TaxID=3346452 RepID=UPI003653573B
MSASAIAEPELVSVIETRQVSDKSHEVEAKNAINAHQNEWDRARSIAGVPRLCATERNQTQMIAATKAMDMALAENWFMDINVSTI